MAAIRPPSPSARDPAPDTDRLLLAIADHLHEHCECTAGERRCPACDLRSQLRVMREELLAWRAEGRRLAARRDDVLANGAEHVGRYRDACDECAALAGLAHGLAPP